MTGRRLTRMEPANAAWCGLESRRAFLGLGLPPADSIRRAVHDLLTEPSPASVYLDTASRRQRVLTPEECREWSTEMVQDVVDPGGGVPDMLSGVGSSLGHYPFMMVVGPDRLGLRMSHAVADGRSCLMLLAHLLEVARGRNAADVPWTVVGPARRDLVTALLLARRPDSVAKAWQRRHELGGGTYEVAEETVGHRGFETVHRASDSSFLPRLREQRDLLWPGASLASVVLCGLRSSLRAHGLAPQPGVETVFDVRRDFPGGATAFGNWSAGVFIRPDDDHSPTSVTHAFVATRQMGYPVVAAAASRRRGRHTGSGTRMVVRPTGRPRLALSYLNAHGPVASLPWAAGGPRALAVSAPPNGLETISIAGQEIGDVLNLSLSVYEGSWPLERVARALDDFVAQPVSHIAAMGGPA